MFHSKRKVKLSQKFNNKIMIVKVSAVVDKKNCGFVNTYDLRAVESDSVDMSKLISS